MQMLLKTPMHGRRGPLKHEDPLGTVEVQSRSKSLPMLLQFVFCPRSGHAEGGCEHAGIGATPDQVAASVVDRHTVRGDASDRPYSTIAELPTVSKSDVGGPQHDSLIFYSVAQIANYGLTWRPVPLLSFSDTGPRVVPTPMRTGPPLVRTDAR